MCHVSGVQPAEMERAELEGPHCWTEMPLAVGLGSGEAEDGSLQLRVLLGSASVCFWAWGRGEMEGSRKPGGAVGRTGNSTHPGGMPQPRHRARGRMGQGPRAHMAGLWADR